VGLALGPVGCRTNSPTGSPIFVWIPPRIESTVGHRIAISEIAGDEKLSEKIHEQLFTSVPRDTGRMLSFIDAGNLQERSPIQLASYADEGTNDVVLASVARNEGIDYLLRGEILSERSARADAVKRLTVSWRLMSLDPNNPSLPAKHVGGLPVVVELESAVKKYPDLAIISDQETMLAKAAARDTYELFAPSIQQERVHLASPYLMRGRTDVLRGNALARAGRWGEAKEIWEQVVRSHPRQTAALHNLALAAVASQDFTTAKQLARQAIKRRSSDLNQSTLVWIELRQRDYHKAFGLPDPPEGWFVTQTPNSSKPISSQNFSAAASAR
jgi:tetratricopeptide (TPR) repeat protein